MFEARLIFRMTPAEAQLAAQAAKKAEEGNLSAWLRRLVKSELKNQGLLPEKEGARK